MIVAITGSIGSGKSKVASLLVEQTEAEHRDTDAICRHLLERGQPGYLQVVAQWGQRFLDAQGEIARTCLRKAVFNDPEIRKRLEDILHPLVRDSLQKSFVDCRRTNRFLIVEVPLLFETGWHTDFDMCVAVIAPTETVIKRVVERDGIAAEQVQQILAVQLDMAEKARLADWVIDNSGSIDKVAEQVDALAQHLKAKQQDEQEPHFP